MQASSLCQELLTFLQNSPTPYHAVESASAMLEQAGFTHLKEEDDFSKLRPGCYYLTRGDSALLSFILPSGKKIPGFRIIGAHTDSPNLRIKPNGLYTKEGYLQLGVETYGGALLNSWLDRDLSIAGRVLVRTKVGMQTRLLRINRALLRVPQLAIHLDREVNDRGLLLNRQEHLNPILSSFLESEKTPFSSVADFCASELHVAPTDILSHDLMLYDVTPPALAGLRGEFIFSSRLDNLAMCHAALSSIIQAKLKQTQEMVPVIALFDHEEVGSQSACGAGTSLLPSLLERITMAWGGAKEDFYQALSRSFCISADMAHAVHPNYSEKHDPRHHPKLNGGPVIKVNQQQRYATSARTAALFRDLCERTNTPVQWYSHRSDLPCGSTIGPMTSTQLGIPTIDIGNATLSMHSIREMAGSKDPELILPPLVEFLTSS